MLEGYAEKLGRPAGIEVEVDGFDTAHGLPASFDHRDLGYLWQRGAWQMDVDGLKSRFEIR